MKRAYSNSELQCYKNCPLQWRFEYDLKLRSREDDSGSHHLRFGSAFDKGLEQLYRGAGMKAAQAAMLAAYPTQLDVGDKAKTAANGCRTLVDYARRWAEEDRKWKVLEIQEYSDESGVYNVKPDMVAESLDHGGVWLWDHKTTGRYLNYDYWSQFQPNSQITHYIDYAQSKYGEIEGFIVNAISFRYRERAYKGEPAGFWNNFERQTFNRNEGQLEFERVSRAAWVEDVERSIASGFYRSNTGACRFCSYKSLCAPGWTWEQDEPLILGLFRQVCEMRMAGDVRCQLDREHEGEHSVVQPQHASMEIEVEV